MLTLLVHQDGPLSGNQYLKAIDAAMKAESTGTELKYTERDVMLYNLGIGAKRTDLPYVL